MSVQQGPYEITAVLENQPSHREGEADAAILPGTGVAAYIAADGEYHVRQAAANENSRRAAIVTGGAKTGPAVGADDATVHPLDDDYAAGEHTYTLGYHAFDQARLRLSGNASADPTDTPVGWDTDGTITDQTFDGTNFNAITEPIARGLEIIDRGTATNYLRVEFL